MANRGCTIVVKLLGGTSGHGETEDISLPVAYHSPLQVLKEQLASLVGINPTDQVLILCDLSDPERNSDKLLTGSEFLSIGDCGIQNGSILTLHALGMSAERKQQITKEALREKKPEEFYSEPIQTLTTEVTPALANHRYASIYAHHHSVVFHFSIGMYPVTMASFLMCLPKGHMKWMLYRCLLVECLDEW